MVRYTGLREDLTNIMERKRLKESKIKPVRGQQFVNLSRKFCQKELYFLCIARYVVIIFPFADSNDSYTYPTHICIVQSQQ